MKLYVLRLVLQEECQKRRVSLHCASADQGQYLKASSKDYFQTSSSSDVLASMCARALARTRRAETIHERPEWVDLFVLMVVRSLNCELFRQRRQRKIVEAGVDQLPLSRLCQLPLNKRLHALPLFFAE